MKFILAIEFEEYHTYSNGTYDVLSFSWILVMLIYGVIDDLYQKITRLSSSKLFYFHTFY